MTIPKAASTALRSALFDQPSRGDLHCELMNSRLNPLLLARPSYARFFIFGFVRNPWARVVSCYENKIANPPDETREWLARYRGVEPGMSFDEFVEFLASPFGADRLANQHWASQHLFVNRFVDMIGRQEQLADDFASAMRRIGISGVSLPIMNARDSAASYVDWYNDETIRLVAKRYAEDIGTFGYRF